MVQTKEFWCDETHGVDYFVNEFLEDNYHKIEVIDIKYQSFHDTINDVIESTVLLIYREII